MLELEIDEFKQNKIYFMLQELNVPKAIIHVEDLILEFEEKGEGRFTLSEQDKNNPISFIAKHTVNKCPVCGREITITDKEQFETSFMEDYVCKHCHFKGTQWFARIFLGHTSFLVNHTIESYKKSIQNN